MKIEATVLAVMTLTAQLALAEMPADTSTVVADATHAAGEHSALQEHSAATDSQIKSLEHDLRPSLQTRLDALMDFELEAQALSRGAIASVD